MGDGIVLGKAVRSTMGVTTHLYIHRTVKQGNLVGLAELHYWENKNDFDDSDVGTWHYHALS